MDQASGNWIGLAIQLFMGLLYPIKFLLGQEYH